MSKPLTLIVACAENRVIGRDGKLPFDIPEDKAKCLDDDGDDLGPGTFFPAPWAQALRERNTAAGMLQPKTQATLDALSGLALVGMSANGEAVAADAADE